MAKTNQEIRMHFKPSGSLLGYDIVIPKGTRVTHQTAMGFDPNYNFIDDLSWIPKEQYGLRHDATYYGINVDAKYVDKD